MMNLRHKYCIVGIGETDPGVVSHRASVGASLIAAQRALDDAGLSPRDVDGVIAASSSHGSVPLLSIKVGELLGMTPLSTALDLELDGASPAAMVHYAAMALEAGQCSAVLCVSGYAMKNTEGEIPDMPVNTDEFSSPYGMFGGLADYAMAAQRHMHRYGTTSRHLGLIAVAERAHARVNSFATVKDPLTIDDHQNSPWVVEPLRRWDCPLPGDGAGAFIIVPRETAKDLKNPPVHIMGIGQSHPHAGILDSDSVTTSGARVSGEKAFHMAGVTIADVDVAEIDDSTTYTVLVQLEDYGFCKKGEAGEFLESEGIEVNKAKIPVNTHGGLLSCANVPGIFHITEAVKQLRGGCGERQVVGAEVALVSGNGRALSAHVTLILRK